MPATARPLVLVTRGVFSFIGLYSIPVNEYTVFDVRGRSVRYVEI